MRTLWDKLAPSKKRLAIFALLGLVIVAGAMLMTEGDKQTRKKPQEAVRQILTDTNTRSLGIEGLGVQLRDLRTENRKLRETLEAMQKNPVLQAGNDIEQLRRQLSESRKQMAELGGMVEAMRRKAERPRVAAKQGETEGTGQRAPQTKPGSSFPGGDLFPFRPAPAEPPSASDAVDVRELFSRPPPPPAPGGSKKVKSPHLTIRLIEAEATAGDEERAKTEATARASVDEVFIPAGAMLRGVLINGVDAPTGAGTRQNPHPVLVRIKHEAILPNRFTADLRECFVIAGGYGDLSSERAYLRAERLSCVRNDGKVIEVPIDAYATGEDGKVGLRGIVVSKQGQLLNKALIAGMAQGFSSMFQKTPVPVIQTDPDSMSLWQSQFTTDRMASAAFAGVGSALDKLADFYLDQAEQMFPVIEIDAGRKTTFILTKGRALKLASSGRKGRRG